MITPQEMEQIVTLDVLNMAPVMARQGIQFDPLRRRRGLVEEIQKGAEFVFALKANQIVGYMEYFLKDGGIHVASIQVHLDYRQGGVLRNLLARATEVAKRSRHYTFTTSIHHANQTSLKLHKMLGFVQTGQTEERVSFKTSGEELYVALKRITRNR